MSRAWKPCLEPLRGSVFFFFKWLCLEPRPETDLLRIPYQNVQGGVPGTALGTGSRHGSGNRFQARLLGPLPDRFRDRFQVPLLAGWLAGITRIALGTGA